MSLGGGLALATAAADTRIAAVIALVPVTDGLAAWLQPAPPAHVARLLGRAVKEAMTRRPVTMPIAGAPGEFAVLAAAEAVPGFTSVTAGRKWRNEVTTSFVFPMGIFRPVRMAPRIQAPVLYQIGDHDKLPAVIRFAGRRPLTWIDDALLPEAHAWASKRRIPTLLIGIDPAEGLTRPVIEQSLQWADDHRRNDQPQT
jgi:hypothetical protein